MTLIFAAIHKDGICVCADTRYVDKKWDNGFKDGFDKIYKFHSHPLIILNHGVNKFNEKYWSDYCFEYEKSGRWKVRDLKSLSEDFKDFIESIVLQQLKFNSEHCPDDTDAQKSGFAICGKNFRNNDFEIYEYFWNPKPVLPELYPWNGIRLNGFGNGYDNYLKKDIRGYIDWGNFNNSQIEKELVRLFSLTRERKNCKHGKEFSDDFIIKSVMD